MGGEERGAETKAAPQLSLWQHGDFCRYWGGQAVTVAGYGITTIGISVLCPAQLQGRAQATGAWPAFGLRPLAAFLAGALGTLVGLRPALGVITLLLCAPFVILWRSPASGPRTSAPALGSAPGVLPHVIPGPAGSSTNTS
ncbi:hypothetical protein [Streptomyces californicus]|uniref:hypothetical protein n=1 Tax=Streptomyces californicus TaxID=67351 RepID=UPI0037B1997C